MARALAVEIGGDVVWDPDPDAKPSPWRTYRHLLETTPAGATHRFQIQDDAVACSGLRRAVGRAVAAQPDKLLVFFVGGHPAPHARQVREACRLDRPFAMLPHMAFVPCVSTCWPRAMIDDLLGWVDEQKWPRQFGADDEIVGRWVRARRIWPLATVPSLVDHRDVVPSLIRMRQYNGIVTGRLTACWVGDCADCVENIPWEEEPLPLYPPPRPRR